MRYPYYLCDVFTEKRFGGNPLAVFPEASGLSDEAMQSIAREFNFSETTFVFPGDARHTRQVRIFTPAREIPFAGHPNIGTACVLKAMGFLGEQHEITFAEKAGTIRLRLSRGTDPLHAELRAPEKLSLGTSLSPELIASALSLQPHDVCTSTHEPQIASVGFPFIFVELQSESALNAVKLHCPGLEAIESKGVVPDIHAYVRLNPDGSSASGVDLQTRMFAPLEGVMEDPATGGANVALAGLLAHLDNKRSGTFQWRAAQGVAMGRPSLLEIQATKQDGAVVETRVGGACVLVADGQFYID